MSTSTDKRINQEQLFSILDAHLAEEGKMFDPIEYVISDERRLVYIVNSKVACSSIKSTFIDTDIADDHSIHQLLIQKEIRKYDLTEDQSTYYAFSFVRNPLSRLVSCYESKYHIDPVKYNRSDLKKYLFGYMAEDEGFDSFIRKVCALPPRLMNRHFRSQYDLLYDENGNCRCDYIGHFETIEDDFKPIQERFGLRPFPHLNRSDEVDWRSYYTEETLDLVLKTFNRDFEAFGYSL